MIKHLALAGALLASTALALPAFALPITITGEDNFGNTDTATAGSPVVFGSVTVGQWSIQGTATGTPPAPLGTLLSNTITFATQGAGSFIVWVTETGLTGPLSPVNYTSKLTSNGFTGPLTATLETFLQSDNSNPGPTVPETGMLLASQDFTDIGTSVQSIAAITGAGPYSLTQEYLVTATDAGGADLTIITSAAVPEPGSLLIFGSALLGLGGVGWFRRRKDSDVVEHEVAA